MPTTVKVLIPTPLRKFTGDQDTVAAEGDSVGSLLKGLITRYPGLEKPLVDEEGNPRRFVNLYVKGEDVRFLQGKETPLKEAIHKWITSASPRGSE
jgi:molybdopterin converting factor small subunit